MPKKPKPSSKPFAPRGAELGPLPMPTEEELVAELMAEAESAGAADSAGWDETMPAYAGLLHANQVTEHDPNVAVVEGLNDHRTGSYTSDDLPDTVLVLVWMDGWPREIGRITVYDAGAVDELIALCFARFCDRNGIGDRKVVRLLAKSEYNYPVQFECPWCGVVRLGYDIKRPNTMSVGSCSHYVIWVTRPDYDATRGMKRLGWHLTYQHRRDNPR